MAIKLSGLSSQNPWWKKGNWENEDKERNIVKIKNPAFLIQLAVDLLLDQLT